MSYKEKAIRVKITPTLGIVFFLSDLSDTEKDIWLGKEVPSSAVPRLDRLQKIVTERIIDAIPKASVEWSAAVVEWSAESVHVLGAPNVHVSSDDERTAQRVRNRVSVIFHEVIASIVEEILNEKEGVAE